MNWSLLFRVFPLGKPKKEPTSELEPLTSPDYQ